MNESLSHNEQRVMILIGFGLCTDWSDLFSGHSLFFVYWLGAQDKRSNLKMHVFILIMQSTWLYPVGINAYAVYICAPAKTDKLRVFIPFDNFA